MKLGHQTKFMIGFFALFVLVFTALHFMGIIAWAGLAPMYVTIGSLVAFCVFVFWFATRVHKE